LKREQLRQVESAKYKDVSLTKVGRDAGTSITKEGSKSRVSGIQTPKKYSSNVATKTSLTRAGAAGNNSENTQKGTHIKNSKSYTVGVFAKAADSGSKPQRVTRN
jgi:hypothetical protein